MKDQVNKGEEGVSAPAELSPWKYMRGARSRLPTVAAERRDMPKLISAPDATGRCCAPLRISLARYARETYGVTAALSATAQEWLALLVQLRATSGRALLFIFNPEGIARSGGGATRRRGACPGWDSALPGRLVGPRRSFSIAGHRFAATWAQVE
jgi:hypothetical protein